MDITRPTVMEVDLSAFEYNIAQIQNYVGENVKIMPVIKASAYGTWINRCIDVINKFNIVAVATVDEAMELRLKGYLNEVFVLNQSHKNEISKIIENNITVGISSDEFLEEIGNVKEKIKVHVEIGTGMGRTGLHPENLENYLRKLQKYDNIIVEGIYTHLSSADIDFEYTEKQLRSFEFAIKIARDILGDLKYIHAGASNGIINFKKSHYNLVRPGIIMYGYKSAEDTLEKIDLKPVCKLKSKITLLKEVLPETSIGYGRTFITKRNTKIATVPIGYADGVRRMLSNKGNVVINGEKAPIIGTVCMDSLMVDVTDLQNVNIGDNVYIWDNENILLEDVASQCETINYEIMSTISERVPRVYYRK